MALDMEKVIEISIAWEKAKRLMPYNNDTEKSRLAFGYGYSIAKGWITLEDTDED